MSINAYEKFTNAIFSRISDYQLINKRNITDIKELEKTLEAPATGQGYSIELVKVLYEFLSASAVEYTYDNGLIYLDSEIICKETDNIHTIRQITLTTDYTKPPLVNVIVTKERKAIQQLLIASDSKDELFPESMRVIERLTTTIYVDNECGSVFESYTNLNDSSLMLEKYMQYYTISDFEYSPEDLLSLCGCGSRDLEIIYNQSKPVFAQFSDEYQVEKAGFNPNCEVDVQRIVNIINEEVDAITQSIHSSLDKLKKNKQKIY